MRMPKYTVLPAKLPEVFFNMLLRVDQHLQLLELTPFVTRASFK